MRQLFSVPELLGSLRQRAFPHEFRIELPTHNPYDGQALVRGERSEPPQEDPRPGAPTPQELAGLLPAVAELATCLWYLKTKHFKQEWADIEAHDDDPRVRRSLRQVEKSIDALRASGIEVHDPTGERYPTGGEGMMEPLQFVPTEGLTFDRVSDAVSPIIYFQDRLLQRGKVFVSVPKEPVEADGGDPVEAAEEGATETSPAEPAEEARAARDSNPASALEADTEPAAEFDADPDEESARKTPGAPADDDTEGPSTGDQALSETP